jgi:hypothetical protein
VRSRDNSRELPPNTNITGTLRASNPRVPLTEVTVCPAMSPSLSPYFWYSVGLLRALGWVRSPLKLLVGYLGRSAHTAQVSTPFQCQGQNSAPRDAAACPNKPFCWGDGGWRAGRGMGGGSGPGGGGQETTACTHPEVGNVVGGSGRSSSSPILRGEGVCPNTSKLSPGAAGAGPGGGEG